MAPGDEGEGEDRLELYRRKRSAERTLEPFGTAGASRPRLFVVQKHRARRMHYDLRLELGGTLRSWAVPNGPSLDPAVKRMAVHVEDHPVEYADFEGKIPEGNYGAGAVIVWDRGTWEPLEDPEEGLVKGKLLFELKGYKLRGVWTLVKTKGNSKDWLLIKKPDAHSAPEGTKTLPQESVLSGLTVEELAEGVSRARALEERLRALGARPREGADPPSPMLAELAEAPFSRAGWIFELKYDGYRLQATREGEEVRLRYRSGLDATAVFPDVARALAKLPATRFLLDGEVVVLGADARPVFNALERRAHLTRPADVERMSVELPATYFAFDLLAFAGLDLRPLPLVERKAALAQLLPKAGPVRYADHIEEKGAELFAQVKKLGLEGIIAKRADSRYVGERSPDWKKVRVVHSGDFVVVGFVEPTGSRAGFSGLNLAAYEGGQLVHVGRVGTGFSDRQLSELRQRLEARRRADAAATGKVVPEKGQVWVDPELVVEVRYVQRTPEGLLRQPVFLRVREDKAPEDCQIEPLVAPPPPAEDEALPPESPAGERRVPFSNLNKVFWPEDQYSKADLIDFYRQVSPWLLPYLRDRPVVLDRFPDGIHGKHFYQKDAPPFVPGWLRTERIWSEHTQREIDYFVCDDVESLLYLVNLATIPLHVWSSRTHELQKPDWSIIDLDPKKAPFSAVIQVARRTKALCDELGLPAFLKTSGSTGLHILIPLGGQCTYEQSRGLAELISRVVVEELPELATLTRAIGSRGEKVYLDYLQNIHGQLLVSPFSVRPLPGAPVSTPLDWEELTDDLDQRRFTIRTVPARLAARTAAPQGERPASEGGREGSARPPADPLLPVLSTRPDLARALDRLARRMKARG